MGKPACRRDHVLERCPALVLHQGDELRLLRSAPRLTGALCALLLSRTLRLIGLAFLSPLVLHGDGRRAGLRDLEPERLLLRVGTPGGLIALDPYLLQEAEVEELRDRGLDGAPLQRLG